MGISDTIHQIVCDTMTWPTDEVHATSPLRDCPGWDSVNQLRVFLALEAALGRHIPMRNFLLAHTIDDVVALVEAQGSQGPRT